MLTVIYLMIFFIIHYSKLTWKNLYTNISGCHHNYNNLVETRPKWQGRWLMFSNLDAQNSVNGMSRWRMDIIGNQRYIEWYREVMFWWFFHYSVFLSWNDLPPTAHTALRPAFLQSNPLFRLTQAKFQMRIITQSWFLLTALAASLFTLQYSRKLCSVAFFSLSLSHINSHTPGVDANLSRHLYPHYLCSSF